MGKSKKHAKRTHRTKMSAYDRLQWAKLQWLDDPTICIQGEKGMIRRMIEHFGVAASYQVLQRLQEGTLKEIADRRRIEKEREEMTAVKKIVPFNPPLTVDQARSLALPRQDNQLPPRSAAVVSADSPPVAKKSETIEKETPTRRRTSGRPKKRDFAEREIFAMQQLRIRPWMPLNGPDGLNEMVRARFGRGISHGPLRALKIQIQAELNEPDTLKSIMSAMPKKKDESKARPPEHRTESDAESAIRTAAELIKESIPNLKEFTLSVDEDGKTRVSYKQHIIKSGQLILDD